MHNYATSFTKRFLAIPTFNKLFHIAPECTFKRPCFQKFLSSSNFQNNVSNYDTMHHEATSFFKSSSAVPTFKESFQIPVECTYSVLNFKIFSAVPTSNTQLQIASQGTVQRPCFQIFLISRHLPLTIFLFGVNFILPTLRPWSQRLPPIWLNLPSVLDSNDKC